METSKTDVATSDPGSTERVRESGPAVVPPVDVYEDASGITLYADMPGVGSDQLELQVDSETLLIEAEASIPLADPMKALHAELRTTRFRRSFALSSELDTDGIQAGLKDGVLTVHLPKKQALRPRRITITAE